VHGVSNPLVANFARGYVTLKCQNVAAQMKYAYEIEKLLENVEVEAESESSSSGIDSKTAISPLPESSSLQQESETETSSIASIKSPRVNSTTSADILMKSSETLEEFEAFTSQVASASRILCSEIIIICQCIYLYSFIDLCLQAYMF